MSFRTRLTSILSRVWVSIRIALIIVVMTVLLGGSVVTPGGLSSRVHAFTRQIEFDFGGWTLNAVLGKLVQSALGLSHFLTTDQQTDLVVRYLSQVQLVQQLEIELTIAYADPANQEDDTQILDLLTSFSAAEAYLNDLAPLAETILQAQLMDILDDAGLAVLGQVVPPSLYRTSDIPQSLILSPRTEIRQALDISLTPGISVDEREQLEDIIFEEIDYAALVVPIGGIGTYPTMVMRSANINWLTEVIAHEWIHNYLTLRPLGINYGTSPELRTINETTASLAGKELGLMLLEKYYPEFVPPESDSDSAPAEPSPVVTEQPAFDFRAEMRITRQEAERLLAEGDVEGAEAYLETRRVFFYENGYAIRKLNQAYFAFYGAYNDEPGGGAAGDDPVGPAVIKLRAQYDRLSDFLDAIAWVVSFEDLNQLLG